MTGRLLRTRLLVATSVWTMHAAHSLTQSDSNLQVSTNLDTVLGAAFSTTCHVSPAMNYPGNDVDRYIVVYGEPDNTAERDLSCHLVRSLALAVAAAAP